MRRCGLAGAVLVVLLQTACEDPLLPPLQGDLVSVTTGAAHSCGLDADGRAWCWGANGSGQLGVGEDVESVAAPVAVAGELRFAALSAGLAHTCGVLLDGRVACWGANAFGQLGDGTRSSREAPVLALLLADAVTVSAGAASTCALDRQGLAWCWGRNLRGQLGNGTLDPSLQPLSVAGGRRFSEIVVGGEHACALDLVGRAYCWGANDVGQSGLTALTDARAPARVQSELVFRQVGAGLLHTCALDEAGAAFCWGLNEEGALGQGGIDGAAFGPLPVLGGLRFRRVEPAWGPWTCALTGSGEAACWGRTDRGAFGATGPIRLRAPTLLGVGGWRSLEPGGGHLCGVTLAGGAACWGEGRSGQLGNGSRADRNQPSPIQGGGA